MAPTLTQRPRATHNVSQAIYSRPAAMQAPRTKTTTTMSPASAEALPDSTIPYPRDLSSRSRFTLPDGKKLTAHQWKVYDHILSIPRGKVTTYGHVSKALQSSPRAVGGALRSNPFHPHVPCHRIIDSKLFIGGFQGEWSQGANANSKEQKKRRLLKEEGVEFDSKGFLLGGESKVWTGM